LLGGGRNQRSSEEMDRFAEGLGSTAAGNCLRPSIGERSKGKIAGSVLYWLLRWRKTEKGEGSDGGLEERWRGVMRGEGI
jgi:hypothetical protein